MATKTDLQEWILLALEQMGGKGKIIDICKHIWANHEVELRRSGDLFYTWQYDMRWAGQKLRDSNILKKTNGMKLDCWQINK